MSDSIPPNPEAHRRRSAHVAPGSAMQESIRKAMGTDAIEQALRKSMGTDAIEQALRKSLGTDAIEQALRKSLGTDAIEQALRKSLRVGAEAASPKAGEVLDGAEAASPKAGEVLDGRPLTHKELDQMRSDISEVLASEYCEAVEAIGTVADEATLEEASDPARSNFDPLQEAFYGHMESFGSWVHTRFPDLSDRAVDGVNRLASAATYALITQFPSLLLTHFGMQGLVVGLLLLGQAEVMTDSDKNRLSQGNRQGIEITCPTCEAVPGMWCITISGKNPGSRAQQLHKPRLNASDQSNSR